MTLAETVTTAKTTRAGQVPTLEEITTALRASWTAQTCDEADALQWSANNPSRWQCGTSALIVHDLLGGQLMIHDVFYLDGTRPGRHYFNLLPDGRAVDLTVQQFAPHEILQPPVAVERPPGPVRRSAEQHALPRQHVLAHISHHDEQPTTTAGAPDLLSDL